MVLGVLSDVRDVLKGKNNLETWVYVLMDSFHIDPLLKDVPRTYPTPIFMSCDDLCNFKHAN